MLDMDYYIIVVLEVIWTNLNVLTKIKKYFLINRVISACFNSFQSNLLIFLFFNLYLFSPPKRGYILGVPSRAEMIAQNWRELFAGKIQKRRKSVSIFPSPLFNFDFPTFFSLLIFFLSVHTCKGELRGMKGGNLR